MTPFRAFAIESESENFNDILDTKIQTAGQSEVWFLYPGLGTARQGMAVPWLRVPTFSKALACHQIILDRLEAEMDLEGALTSTDIKNSMLRDPVTLFIATVSFQLALRKVL